MSDQLPVYYNEARRSLAACVRVDEVKKIRDRAVAIEVYARQAKDAQLIAHAIEIKRRAERRIGELMEADRTAGRLKRGPRAKRVAARPNSPTLASRGIDKHLADRARKAASMPAATFEKKIAAVAAAAAEGDDKAIVRAARAEAQAEKATRRRQREAELAEKTKAAASKIDAKLYGVIYADPPWRFEPYSRDSGMDRAADNHYPTMTLDAIKALKVPAAPDCALFVWATFPLLREALAVMGAWGFEYRTAFVWHKEKVGTGYWLRSNAELLMLGVRGRVPAPAPGQQSLQTHFLPQGRHSEKPATFAEIIEAMFPTTPRVELFARAPRPGWDAWGNEAEERRREPIQVRFPT